jgi:hypothetical protein
LYIENVRHFVEEARIDPVYIENVRHFVEEARIDPVFRCQWIKHPNGVNVDNYGLTLIDLNNLGHKDDPWVLADRVA